MSDPTKRVIAIAVGVGAVLAVGIILSLAIASRDEPSVTNSPSYADAYQSWSLLKPDENDGPKHWRTIACDRERDLATVWSQVKKANGDYVWVASDGYSDCSSRTFYATREPIWHRAVVENAYDIFQYHEKSYH